jgi:hypothetical protein
MEMKSEKEKKEKLNKKEERIIMYHIGSAK